MTEWCKTKPISERQDECEVLFRKGVIGIVPGSSIMQNKANFSGLACSVPVRASVETRDPASLQAGAGRPKQSQFSEAPNRHQMRCRKEVTMKIVDDGRAENKANSPIRLAACVSGSWRGRPALASRRHLAGAKPVGEQGQDGLATKRLTASLQARISFGLWPGLLYPLLR